MTSLVRDSGEVAERLSIDSELVERLMRKHGFLTKRRPVEFALHQAAGYDPKKMLELEASAGDADREQ